MKQFRLSVIAAVIIPTLLAVPSCASTIVLTFEGLKTSEPIMNFYDGGWGGLGSGPGPNEGITFSADSLAVISSTASGGGNFYGNPSGNTVAFFLTGSGDTMNGAAGFTTGFSFYYSSPFNSGVVGVYSGLNGTGTLLATLALPPTPQGRGAAGCDSNHDYCPWVPFGVSFAGTAKSVLFDGTVDRIGFDNITLGSVVPQSAPEPAASRYLLLGLAAVSLTLWARQKRRRSSNF
jgi:hypothetical protein